MGIFTAICLNPQIVHGDMKENVSGCFFSEHSVYDIRQCSYFAFTSSHTPSITTYIIFDTHLLHKLWIYKSECKNSVDSFPILYIVSSFYPLFFPSSRFVFPLFMFPFCRFPFIHCRKAVLQNPAASSGSSQPSQLQ